MEVAPCISQEMETFNEIQHFRRTFAVGLSSSGKGHAACEQAQNVNSSITHGKFQPNDSQRANGVASN
jgi:hypothetical protein